MVVSGLMACGPSATSGSPDMGPCYEGDMMVRVEDQPFCLDFENRMVCPGHACTAQDCPPGCTFGLS